MISAITGRSGTRPIWLLGYGWATPIIRRWTAPPVSPGLRRSGRASCRARSSSSLAVTRPASAALKSIIDRVVCSLSGAEPSAWCRDQRTEIFASDQPPLPASQDLWQEVEIDTWTGLRVSEWCPGFSELKSVINVTDPWAVKWIKESDDGRSWAEKAGFNQPFYFTPERQCREGDPRPDLKFTVPGDGQVISGSPLEIHGIAAAPGDFNDYSLSYGEGDNPSEWIPLLEAVHTPVSQPGLLYSWDLREVPAGRITLKLTLHSLRGTFAEKKIRLDIQAPTLTPSPEPSITPPPGVPHRVQYRARRLAPAGAAAHKVNILPGM